MRRDLGQQIAAARMLVHAEQHEDAEAIARLTLSDYEAILATLMWLQMWRDVIVDAVEAERQRLAEAEARKHPGGAELLDAFPGSRVTINETEGASNGEDASGA